MVFWMAVMLGCIAAFNVRLGTEIAAQHYTPFFGHRSADGTFNFQRRVIQGHSSLLPQLDQY
jgi:hypothetical protein